MPCAIVVLIFLLPVIFLGGSYSRDAGTVFEALRGAAAVEEYAEDAWIRLGRR